MLVIRLSRTGRKKQPYYRVVVAEKSAPIQGRFVEVLGHYNPRTKETVIDADRAKARLASGAQPSETAEMLLEKTGVLKRAKVADKHRRPTRKPRKEAEPEAAAPAPVAAEEAATTSADAAEAPGTPAEEVAEAPAETAAEQAEETETTNEASTDGDDAKEA